MYCDGTACRNPKLRPNASKLLQHDFVRDVADTQIRNTSSSFDSPRKAPAAHISPVTELQFTHDGDSGADSLHANSTGDVLQSIEEVQEEPQTPVSRPTDRIDARTSDRRRSNVSDSESNLGAGNESTINEWLSLQATETDALSKMLIAQNPGSRREGSPAARSQPGLPIVVESINGTITGGDPLAIAAGGTSSGDVVSPEQVQARTTEDAVDDRPIQTLGRTRSRQDCHRIIHKPSSFVSPLSKCCSSLCLHGCDCAVSVSKQNQEEVAKAQADLDARQAKAAADQAAFDAEQEAFRQSQMQP